MLCISEEDVDAQKPMHRFGVDSLVAVEVRYWLINSFKADVSIVKIMGNASLAELGAVIARKDMLMTGAWAKVVV